MDLNRTEVLPNLTVPVTVLHWLLDQFADATAPNFWTVAGAGLHMHSVPLLGCWTGIEVTG